MIDAPLLEANDESDPREKQAAARKTTLVSAVVTYLLLGLCQVVKPLRGAGPALVFTWMLGALTCIHLYRMHIDYLGWSLDVSGPMMLLTMK